MVGICTREFHEFGYDFTVDKQYIIEYNDTGDDYNSFYIVTDDNDNKTAFSGKGLYLMFKNLKDFKFGR